MRQAVGRRARTLQVQLTHRGVELFTPVVEIAGHDQQFLRRHVLGQEVGQPQHLTHTAAMGQAEMHHHGVQRVAVPLHRHVQQAPLLEAVVADVVVADRAERPARQQRIAVLAVARDGIGAVGHVVALGRQEIGLAAVGPAEPGALELARGTVVEQPHLLQEHQVGVQRLDTEAEVVDLQALARTDAAHALVDVVGGHAQHRQVQRRRRREARGSERVQRGHEEAAAAADGADGTKRGSCRMASALLGEKQRSAASRQDHQP